MPTRPADADRSPDLWDQQVYAQFYREIDPFRDRGYFRPLDKAYDGDNTFWATPSPEPDLSDDFWAAVAAHLPDERIRRAGRCLAEAVSRWEPDGSRLVFAAILRAGVPVADWLRRLLPGAAAVSLSLFVGLGIDRVALESIRRRYPDRRIVFVDGWTGRGGVARTIAALGQGPLAVLVDPWGWADFCGLEDDVFCPTACFTGVATLGFSRTFFVDKEEMFAAYRFPARYHQKALVAAWQAACPARSEASAPMPAPRRFHRETPLRIHANEVCRALINAAPKRLMFREPAGAVQRRYPLLLELAERRKVAVDCDVRRLADLRTRVACTLSSA